MGAENREVLRPGDPMGGYRVVRRLGGGAFGDVYGAVNGLAFCVVIKTLKREHMRSGDLRARFVREGLSAVKIRHPNAVQVLDGGEEGGTPYLVMELLDGEDLETLLARTGVLPPARAVDLVLPVMAAVAAAHDEGVIHRDLKPANLFLAKTRDGEVVPKVVDFGISRLKSAPEDGVATRDGALMGSPAYMSPADRRGAGGGRGKRSVFPWGDLVRVRDGATCICRMLPPGPVDKGLPGRLSAAEHRTADSSSRLRGAAGAIHGVGSRPAVSVGSGVRVCVAAVRLATGACKPAAGV